MTESKSDPSEDMAFLCSECETGLMHLKHVTYFTWLNDELVTVPDFPAWICDHCGLRRYDSRAVSWITTLLNPATGQPRVYRRRPGQIRTGHPIP